MGAWIIVGLLLLLAIGSIWAKNDLAKKEKVKLDAMSLDERQAYLAEKARRAELARQRRVQAARQQKVDRGKVAISEVGRVEGQAGLACPKCGGGQFKARRSTAARVGVATTTVATGGLAGLGAAAVTKQKQVQCVTCGAKYMRG